jgi:hypothetical protein
MSNFNSLTNAARIVKTLVSPQGTCWLDVTQYRFLDREGYEIV